MISEYTRFKLHLGRLGKKHTEASRNKMRDAKLGKTYSDDHKKAISEGMKKYHARRDNE
jgi:hypothetical protein